MPDNDFLDEDQLEYMSDEDREYYEYIRDHGSPDEVEKAKEYFG